MTVQPSVFLRVTRGVYGELICEVEDCAGAVDDALLADAEAAARLVEGMFDGAATSEKPRPSIC